MTSLGGWMPTGPCPLGQGGAGGLGPPASLGGLRAQGGVKGGGLNLASWDANPILDRFGQNGPAPGGTPRDPPGTEFCTFRRVFNKSPIRDKHGTPFFSVFLQFWDKHAFGTNMICVWTNIMALYIAIWGVYTVPPTPPIFCMYSSTYLTQNRSFWGYPGDTIGIPRETPE